MKNYPLIAVLGVFALLATATIAGLIYLPDDRTTEWHMINVNYQKQGDAHLIVDGPVNTLIDTGRPEAAEFALIPYLQQRGITTIHNLFLSHPHTDHYGGLQPLVEAGISIENIYHNLPHEGTDDWNYKRAEYLAAIKQAEDAGARLFDISIGFTLSLPSSSIETVHANKAEYLNGKKLSINDYSTVLKWSAGQFKILFTGDLGKPLGTELANTARNLQADILKVPHHGVTGVPPDSFFDAVAPALNMFPSTKALWGHPRIQQTRKWTQESGIYYCNNGLNGSVVLTFSSAEVVVKSEAPTPACPDGLLDIVPLDSQ